MSLLRLADDLRQDVSHAARTLLRTRGFVLCVATLALAIGATTAVHGTLVWLTSRSSGGVESPDEIVALQTADPDRPDFGVLGLSFPQYLQIRGTQDVFVDMAAYAKVQAVLTDGANPERLVVEFATGAYFRTLGVRPAVGRAIQPEDDLVGQRPVAVLSHRLWVARFGGDPGIVGTRIRINGEIAEVVGVAPRTFEGYSLDWNGPTDVWISMRTMPSFGFPGALERPISLFRVLARLRSGADRGMVIDRATAWSEILANAGDGVLQATELVVRPAQEMRIERRSDARRFLGPLRNVCVLILLAACFSTASFLFERLLSRGRDRAVRIALGAAPGRLLRHALTDAALVGATGGLLGVIVAAGMVRLLSPLTTFYLGIPSATARLTTDGAVDLRLAGVGMVLGLGVAALAGMAPALRSFESPMTALRAGASTWSWNRARFGTRQSIFALQVGLTVALSVVAGLYARSFLRASSVPSGYADTESVLVARVSPATLTAEEGDAFYGGLLETLNSMPQVAAAGIGWNAPFVIGVARYGRPDDPNASLEAGSTSASPRFFAAAGVPFLAGTEFDPSGADASDGLIVNSVFAETLWPGEDPVGRTVLDGDDRKRVVGVVPLERCRQFLGEPEPCVWQPFPMGRSGGYLRVRTRGAPLSFIPSLHAAVRELHPDVVVAEEVSLRTLLRQQTLTHRVSAWGTSALAGLGILLMLAGCVSLFVAVVRAAHREIAVRIALGATYRRVAWKIVSRGVLTAVPGVALGMVAAYAVGRRMEGQLYGTRVTDWLAFLAVPGIVVLLSAAAMYLAARTAAEHEPVSSL